MEDLLRYLALLKGSDAIAQRIINTLTEDKQNISLGMSGEAEQLYRQQCDQAIEEVKKIQKRIRVLYSESSSGS